MTLSIPEILSLAGQYAQELPPAPPALTAPQGAEIAAWIDHTLLAPTATAAQIERHCKEALEHKFAAVCVNPVYVPLAFGLLRTSGIGICSTVAFPLGANLPDYKVAETRSVIEKGATEIDMVLNIGALKGEAYKMVLFEIRTVAEAAHEMQARVKIIIETALLSQEEKIIACLLAKEGGADFVKTSTGFGPGGATVDDVSLMRRVVGAEMGVKASNGIRTYQDALVMIQAGANRIGTSAGLEIFEEAVR